MPDITIYTTPTCSYCHRAKGLLRRKSVAFTEIDVSADPSLRQMMTQKAHGRRTVPQIFVGDSYLGDCDGIHELDAAGKLDPLLVA